MRTGGSAPPAQQPKDKGKAPAKRAAQPPEEDAAAKKARLLEERRKAQEALDAIEKQLARETGSEGLILSLAAACFLGWGGLSFPVF